MVGSAVRAWGALSSTRRGVSR